VTEIFGGKMRSVVRKKGLKASASIEPFFSLPLDVKSDEVATINDALRLYMTSEKLSDYTANNQTVQASKQITIESLPRVLTLHLKRFEYTLYGIEKIHKVVSFGPELKIHPTWLANEKAYSPAQRTYKLFAVISHWGKTGIGGHYTCDILQPTGEWMQFDDDKLSKVTLETVLNRPAYLLMYIRQGE
jgi:ubiquitin carboxyl-terminal hydrolase 10